AETPIFSRTKSLCGRNSMVECQLPKLKVAGSIPVARSTFPRNSQTQISKVRNGPANTPQILSAQMSAFRDDTRNGFRSLKSPSLPSVTKNDNPILRD